MALCARHDDALQLALELRGFLRPTLIADADLAPLHRAQAAILEHATNFCGKASVKMLAEQRCPLCFVNEAIRRDGKNPGLTVDDWVEHAADEAVEADIAAHDGLRAPINVLV